MIDRTAQPPYKLPTRVTLPECLEHTIKNGIQLYSIKAGTQDLLRLTLVFNAGSRYGAQPFVASAMLNMLSEGTQKYSSAQIAELLDFYGIYYDTSLDRDYSMITVSCLNKFLGQALELLEECLIRPLFLESELNLYKTKRKQQLAIEREKPSYIARELFSVALFGADHPYGIVSKTECYDKLSVEDLRNQHTQYYGAENCFAVASGMLNADTLTMIQDFLARLPYHGNVVDPLIKMQAQSDKEVFHHRPEAMQSSIRLGKLLFTKGHPDYNGMQLLAMVLGGYFGSRLVDNLREKNGYTYGIYSALVNLQQEGYIAIATDVAAQHTQDAIREIHFEIERLRTELIPQEELDMVRNIIIGEMMRILDGPFGIADVTIENIQCGMTNEYLNTFIEDVATLEPEDLRKLAQKYLDPHTFTQIIVGKNE